MHSFNSNASRLRDRLSLIQIPKKGKSYKVQYFRASNVPAMQHYTIQLANYQVAFYGKQPLFLAVKLVILIIKAEVNKQIYLLITYKTTPIILN